MSQGLVEGPGVLCLIGQEASAAHRRSRRVVKRSDRSFTVRVSNGDVLATHNTIGYTKSMYVGSVPTKRDGGREIREI